MAAGWGVLIACRRRVADAPSVVLICGAAGTLDCRHRVSATAAAAAAGRCAMPPSQCGTSSRLADSRASGVSEAGVEWRGREHDQSNSSAGERGH